MGRDQRTHPQAAPAQQPHRGHEQQHQRHPCDNLRIDHGKICYVHHNPPGQAFHGVYADGRHGAQHSGSRRRHHRDKQRIAQSLQNQPILKKLLIPPQGKAAPHRAAAGLRVIEGKHNQHKNGGIQKQENEKGVDTCTCLFHISMPPSSVSPPSSN